MPFGSPKNHALAQGRRVPTLPIVLAGFAAFLDLYAPQPLLPLLARTFGASTFEAGLTITSSTIAVALFAPFIGRLADRLGLKRVIVGSACMLTVATALAATSRSLPQLLFWRFVQGVATPGIFASTVAYIHEVWPASHAGRGTAAYMTGTILGGFTGRAVAGMVAADVSWQWAFVALAVLSGIIAATLWLRLPDESVARLKPRAPGGDGVRDGDGARDRPPHGARGFSRASGFRSLLQNRRLMATCGVGFCVLFTQVAMFTYVTFHLAAPPYALSTIALGWLFVVYLVGAVVTPVGGRLIDRYGHRVGLGSAMTVGGLGALLTLAPSLAAVAAGLALCSTGVFVAQATTSSYIGAVTTRDRALAVGVYSTFYYAGGSVGGALPSIFWNTGGWSACVLLVVGIQTLGALIALTQWQPAPAHHEIVLPE